MTTETTYYLTKEGLERIKKEYKLLVEFKKAKTRGEVPSVLHSEEINPEYLAFQEDLSLLEVRLSEHEAILRNAKLIVPPRAAGCKLVSLGAKVTILVDEKDIDEFEIVGTLEANPSLGRISNESPVGKALLGHMVGERVLVSSPTETTFTIQKIRYRS
ncbi:MAG: GreA/GreB family elongation factor [Parcubacteria group bacterium]|nr:GreA/GreB family elongation factor [Parcubacteria group bacterium]